MLKTFISYLFAFLVMVLGLSADEQKKPLHALYLVTEDTCESITRGNSYFIEDDHKWSYLLHSNGEIGVEFRNEDHYFLIFFAAPREEVLAPGVYKNAQKMYPNYELPRIDLFGSYGGYSREPAEFEIYEIETNQQGKLTTFAADFKYGDLRGAIRINSTYPVKEYFIKMTDPNINYNQEQFFYVTKKDDSQISAKEKVLILKDRTPIKATLSQNKEELAIEVSDSIGKCYKNKIQFRIPIGYSFKDQNFFILNDLKNTTHNDWWPEESDSDSFSARIQEKIAYPSVYMEQQGWHIEGIKGYFVISELVYDYKNDNVLSLAIDFSIEDRYEASYDGVIRYHSKMAIAQPSDEDQEPISEPAEASEAQDHYFYPYSESSEE